MKRIDGDLEVACQFKAAEDILQCAIDQLETEHPIGAMRQLVAAKFVLTVAMGRLEQIADVPFTAIAIDPTFGR